MIQEGGCLCGAIRFKVSEPPLNVRVCHCRLCQKATGAPFYARALFETKAVTIHGPLGRHASSAHLDRGFCQVCGSTVGAFRRNGTAAGLALALFDDRNAFVPTDHIWTSEKLDWVLIPDDMPQFAGSPT
ncbi:MAG TPA: GFA family protein [Hyphomicrobiaceae bacterium]|nr:GFA family protein [Hyphomicrobiaceae bacterium]